MVDITALRLLAERLEKATGPDRELDFCEVLALLLPGDHSSDDIEIALDNCRVRDRLFRIWLAAGYESAALALVERLLPGWEWSVGTNMHEDVKVFSAIIHKEFGKGQDFFRVAPTPALAILRALVFALIAKEEGNA